MRGADVRDRAGGPGGRDRSGPGDYPERVLVPPPGDATRAAHDVVVSAVRATVRGTIGLVTSAGRLVKLNVLELSALSAKRPGAGATSLAGGTPVTEFTSLSRGETVVGLCAVDFPMPGPGVWGSGWRGAGYR